MYSKKFNNCVTVCAAVAVVGYTIFLVIVMIVVSNVKKMDETDNSPSQSFCLKIKENGQLSCGSPVTLINDLKTKVLERNYKLIKEHNKRDIILWREEDEDNKNRGHEAYSRSVPMAKVLGEDFICDKDGKLKPVKTWCDGVRLTNRGGMEWNKLQYYRGRLVAPVTGLYLAFSYVEFHEPCSMNGTSEYNNFARPIEHALYKYSVKDDENVRIAMSKQSFKKGNKLIPYIVYKSQLSTVLHLYAGDELSVEVTNKKLFEKGHDNSFSLIFYQ